MKLVVVYIYIIYKYVRIGLRWTRQFHIFCRCKDHSKIIKEVESILFSLSLILAIASKVFSLAGLTRFIILAPDPYFQKKKKITVELIKP